MTTTAAEPAVGSRITDRQQLLDLPPGAMIRNLRRGTRYTKDENGQFVREQDNAHFPPDNFVRASGSYVIDVVPPPIPEPATDEEPFDYDESGEATGGGDGVLTLARYQQRMRTVLTSIANSRLNETGPADRVLEKSGCPEFALSPGMLVAYCDHNLIARLPEGTVGFIGHPDEPRTHAVFGLRSHRFVRILGVGQQQRGHDCWTIESIPEVEPQSWFTNPPSESEGEQIKAFMKKVWMAGGEEKSRYGWCGEYEQLMSRWAQLDYTAGNSLALGQNLTPDRVRQLPEGSIVRFVGALGSALFRRDNSSRNPCRTVRIGGKIGGSWARRGMTVVYQPPGDIAIVPHSTNEIHGMPTGTLMTDGRRIYARQSDGRWRSREYGDRYHSQDFSYTYMRFTSFPAPEEQAT